MSNETRESYAVETLRDIERTKNMQRIALMAFFFYSSG